MPRIFVSEQRQELLLCMSQVMSFQHMYRAIMNVIVIFRVPDQVNLAYLSNCYLATQNNV